MADDMDLQALVESDMESTTAEMKSSNNEKDSIPMDNGDEMGCSNGQNEVDDDDDDDLMNPFPHLISHQPLYRSRLESMTDGVSRSPGQAIVNNTQTTVNRNHETNCGPLESSVRSNSSITSSTLSDASMSSPTQGSLTVGPIPIPSMSDVASPLTSSGSSPAMASFRNGFIGYSSSPHQGKTSTVERNSDGTSQKDTDFPENLKQSWFSLPSPRQRTYSFSSSPFGKVYHLDGREVNDPNAVTNSIYIGPKQTQLVIYTDENVHRNIMADELMSAGDLAHVLIHRTRSMENSVWCIVEQISSLGIERSLEDHEKILEIVELNWPTETPSTTTTTTDNSSTASSFLSRGLSSFSSSNSPTTTTTSSNGDAPSSHRFCFRKDFRRFELFKNPLQTFPLQMLSLNTEANNMDTAEIYKRIVSMVSVDASGGDDGVAYRGGGGGASEKVPELQGHVVLRESGKRGWRKAFAFLRGSGFYVSSKGTSKEPRHLQLVSCLQESSVYTVVNSKQTGVNPPTEFCFCLKPEKTVAEAKEIHWISVEDERQRQCWLSGLRLAKYGQQLRENYREAERRERRELRSQSRGRQYTYPSALASPVDDVHWSQNRVAMDFSGPDGGRVIEDPNEAEGAIIEEAHGWRQRAVSNAAAVSQARNIGSGATPNHAYRPSSIRGGGGQRWSLAGVEETSPSSSVSTGGGDPHWDRMGALSETRSPFSASPLSSSPHYLPPPHPHRSSRQQPFPAHHQPHNPQPSLTHGEDTLLDGNDANSSSLPPPPSSSSPFLHPGAAVHLGQPWFHGRIGREEAQDLIKSQGAVDGLYLLRESLSIAGTYVLTLAHDLKIRHFRISTIKEMPRPCFSLDGGRTKFTDLIQLVEFYQINVSGLPVRLTNGVCRVT